ncbi:hypothetical protein FQA39_LY03258 [Lamprigera yunnana]|nr:hypothetical protein FQA39_LY03258 [Lamprigera yunnana]
MEKMTNSIPPLMKFLVPKPIPSDMTPYGSVVNRMSTLTLNENLKKRRKVRRGLRVRKNKDEHCDSMPDIDSNCTDSFNFKIRAVPNHCFGKVFRIKHFGCRHIHNSFNQTCLDQMPSVQNATPSTSRAKSVVSNQNGILTPTISNLHPDSVPLQSNTKNAGARIFRSSPIKKKPRKVKQYPVHWTSTQVQKGFVDGSLIEGYIRINQKNYTYAYVSGKDQSLPDYHLPTVNDRNRALDGDYVAIKLKPQKEWSEKQKTATVVAILEKVHSRVAIGQLIPPIGESVAVFVPRDKRIPKIKVCLKDVLHTGGANEMYKAKITSWIDINCAHGELLEYLGTSGILNTELDAILAENNLDIKEFSPDYMKYTMHMTDISLHDIDNRVNLINECIFTIDPLTARDLDDAVSCKELPNGNLEIGVHISDVSFHLPENTPLDVEIRKKATSIYFVNNVFHMLPQELCEHCSLLPGVNKRAFSVIWQMSKNAEIIEQHFCRTVINSCVQLSYEHAQMMIENPDKIFNSEELPHIHGGFTCRDLSSVVNSLQQIALILRKKRFDAGALRLDQTKLLFHLDRTSGEPLEVFTYENKDAHRLIEEFMLLANISVAEKLKNEFPTLAFLRCHDPPKENMLFDLQKNLKPYGLNIDISSSKALQDSIWNASEKLGPPQMAVLYHLLAKPMNRARYICAANPNSLGDYSHYALHVPTYTHFTSPIRRYADIMVHRLLSVSLGYSLMPKWTVNTVAAIAENCNRQKQNAKQAGDTSSDLYFAHYVEKHQPFIRTAVVFVVRNRSFDILVHSTGSIIRIQDKLSSVEKLGRMK